MTRVCLRLGVDLVRDTRPVTAANRKTNNGLVNVPSVLLTPAEITKEKVRSIVADGFQKRVDICKGLETLCKQH